ncbi:predicted protein [Naegleria gruberi]|uniref:Predicted protein n=1 Tax=Naegleria gruberi TaxID=5762 RepID=D2VYD6_NAEGR|nr:uncharacterized protein NAEGRDRAFT_74083 [Naegleria gruberi]EFC38224.1 predicted protein [Naegleria gruberi]|eukprot:XP_002670968.1 predicted protein [Naegleria gruberi strain NEG-M]
MPTTRKKKILVAIFGIVSTFILIQIIWWSWSRGSSTPNYYHPNGESSTLSDYCYYLHNNNNGKSLSMKQVLEILTRNTASMKYPLQQHGNPYIVTAVSSGYFERFENFVGSIHRIYETKEKLFNIQASFLNKDSNIERMISDKSSYWWNWNSYLTSESRPIIVYNLGMTSEQVQRAKTFKNVEVVDIDFKLLPSHFNNLKSFAWKPLVMYLALQRYPAIFFLDSGVEVWNRLDRYESILMEKGYFHVVQEGLTTGWKCCGTVGELTHISTFNYLGFSQKEYGPKVMCSGGIQGYIKDSPAYKNVLLPTLECAWNSECIAPKGSSLANHRQDQSVFSLFIHKAGLVCETDPRLWGNPGNRAGIPDSEFVIYLRKGDPNKPHIRNIEYEKGLAIVIPVKENEKSNVLKKLDLWNENKYSPCWNYPTSMKVDLVIYMTHRKDETFESDVNQKTTKYSHCFNKISFKYTETQEAILSKVMQDDSIFNNYEYFLFMESNSKPIRANWINEMDSIISKNRQSNPSFWMIATLHKGSTPQASISSNSIFSTHISLRTLFREVSSLTSKPTNAELTSQIYEFLHKNENQEMYKHIKSRIIYHDFIQNLDDWNEENVRALYPNTFLITGLFKQT